MKRGFKSWCENISTNYRNILNLKETDPLCSFELAKHLQITIITPDKIKGLPQKDKGILLCPQDSFWSAVTLSVNKKDVVIYNSSHLPKRTQNDIMHELSHIIIGHKPRMMYSFEMEVFLRYYDSEQEEEANWLAATLLLPSQPIK